MDDRARFRFRRVGVLLVFVLGLIAVTAIGAFSLGVFERRLPAPVPAGTPAAGPVHIVRPEGFSLDIPGGWFVYYPHDRSTMDQALVTVASNRLEAPCPSDWCQRFTTPPGTVAIEFRIGHSPESPSWVDAPTTIGGAPAFREDWGRANATGADEGHTWNALQADGATLIIYVSLRGPNLPALRETMDQVLGSLHIDR
jgi:hypothetical protein